MFTFAVYFNTDIFSHMAPPHFTLFKKRRYVARMMNSFFQTYPSKKSFYHSIF